MKNLILAAAVTALAAGAPPSVHAQASGGAPHWRARLMEADANKDGKVSKGELQAARTAEFDRLDKNHDGVLSADELGAMADHAKRMDASGDGKITKAEFTNVDRIFDRLDKNKDGLIDQSEIPAGPPTH